MFYCRDNQDSGYRVLNDKIAGAGVLKGTPQLVQDTFGYWWKDRELAGEEVAFIYWNRQCLADKITGTGEAIISGNRLFAVVAQNFLVTPNPAGVLGVDYYYCGVALEDAGANTESVLMEFDGKHYDQIAA